jgi:hypothetical protein
MLYSYCIVHLFKVILQRWVLHRCTVTIPGSGGLYLLDTESGLIFIRIPDPAHFFEIILNFLQNPFVNCSINY